MEGNEYAKIIVDKLGGKNNILAFQCRTSRLRIFVFDASICRFEELKLIEETCGLVVHGNALQVVVKESIVTEVIDTLSEVTGINNGAIDYYTFCKISEGKKYKNTIQKVKKIILFLIKKSR